MFIGNFSWTNEQAWTNEHEQWGEQSCATYARMAFSDISSQNKLHYVVSRPRFGE